MYLTKLDAGFPIIKNTACLLLTLFVFTSFAQIPKREMRATWIATVGGIDFPKATTAANQKTEMLKMLDSIKSLNLNAVFLQVRSRCDAMYNSAYEPWSSDLKIARGATPSYDPLEFVIEECHKRGLECHAWLNPYRYNNSGNEWSGSNNPAINYQNTHPEWLLHYSSYIILDPAQEEVRLRIKSVVGDILSKYDVDGIIFDDYFYPYGGTTTQDAASVAKYKPADKDVHDWRRENVNRMIADVYDTIQAVRPYVRFGVSPFGIWTTSASVAAKEGITLPSGITGGNMYQEIYCDPVAWLKEGTVDYISPQLYWKTGGSQDYNKLCPWWADLANKFGVHFYSSMAIYKYAEKTDAAYTVTELANQAVRDRSSAKDEAPGHVFYNTLGWVYDTAFRNRFRANEFAKHAIPPAVGWKPANDQGMVTFNAPSGTTISWIYNETTDDVRYVVYGVPIAKANDPSVYSKSDYVLGISYEKQFTLPTGVSTSSYRLAVSVLDRYGNEFSPRVLGGSLVDMVQPQLSFPNDYAVRKLPVNFKWYAIDKADNYVFQLATDPEFTDIVCTRETTATEFSTASQLNIKEDGATYYWRVRVRKANSRDVWSETRRVVFSQTGETGIEDDISASSGLKAHLEGSNLVIESSKTTNCVVFVYNIAGQLKETHKTLLNEGKNALPLEADGLSLITIKTDYEEITIKTLK